jgi:hypothetical protein
LTERGGWGILEAKEGGIAMDQKQLGKAKMLAKSNDLSYN